MSTSVRADSIPSRAVVPAWDATAAAETPSSAGIDPAMRIVLGHDRDQTPGSRTVTNLKLTEPPFGAES
jgi:hypothetical protein